MGVMRSRRPFLIGLLLMASLAWVPDLALARNSGRETAAMEGASCIDLPPADFEDAVAQGYCGSDGTDLWSGPVAPAGTVTGNCGSATLEADALRRARTQFFEAARSSRGPINYVRWQVVWVNQRTERQDNVGGREARFTLSSTWEHSDVVSTGTGRITGTMTGYVLTALGLCTFLNPADSVRVE